jgi:hypothetical protein
MELLIFIADLWAFENCKPEVRINVDPETAEEPQLCDSVDRRREIIPPILSDNPYPYFLGLVISPIPISRVVR